MGGPHVRAPAPPRTFASAWPRSFRICDRTWGSISDAVTPCGLAAWPCSRAFSRAAPRFSALVFELGLSSLVPALSGSLLSRAAVRQCGRAQPMVDLGADAQ